MALPSLEKSEVEKETTLFFEQCQSLIHRHTKLASIEPISTPSISPPPSINSLLQLTISDGYLPEDNLTFDYSFFIFVSLKKDGQNLGMAYFLNPDTINSHSQLVTNGRKITNTPICHSRNFFESIAAILFRIKRSFMTQRIQSSIDKLSDSLDYENDYVGSVKLAKTIIGRIETLNQCQEVEPFLGGIYDVPAKEDDLLYLNFLGENLKSGDARKLLIKEDQLFVGSSLDIASPWRYSKSFTLRLGLRPEKESHIRSIIDLRRQYALTAGTIGKEEDKTIIQQQLEKEALLRKRRALTYEYGRENLKRLPFVSPIIIEVAENLIHLFESQDKHLTPEFQGMLDMMRDGLQYELGHKEISGVLVNKNETDLPHNTYQLMIFELPLVSGKVQLDQILCNDTVDRLILLNIKGEEAINPANGSECAWIPIEFKKLAEEAGLTTWDATGYIILHLSSVIRKNFAEFVNIQTVTNEIKQKANTYYEGIYGAFGGIARFTNAIKLLAEEEVKLHAVEDLCATYLELTRQKTPLFEILEELRMLDKIRPNLLGNKGDSQVCIVYLLDETITELINNGITSSGDATLLALEPEPTQEILTAVRNEVANLPPTAQNPVICVEDWKIRRPVRKLVELEFPHLAVLAMREITKEIQPIAKISMD